MQVLFLLLMVLLTDIWWGVNQLFGQNLGVLEADSRLSVQVAYQIKTNCPGEQTAGVTPDLRMSGL